MPRPIRGMRIATRLWQRSNSLSRSPLLVQFQGLCRLLFRGTRLLPIRNKVVATQLLPVWGFIPSAQYIPSAPKIPPEKIHDYRYDCDADDFFEHTWTTINVRVFISNTGKLQYLDLPH